MYVSSILLDHTTTSNLIHPSFLSNHAASKLPQGSYHRVLQPVPAQHRSSRRLSPQDSLSIRSADSGYSATSVPPSKPHSLQLDTALMNQAPSVASSHTYVDTLTHGKNNARRSSDSTRTMPGPSRRDRPLQDRSWSISASTLAHVRSSHADQTVPSPASTSSRLRHATSQSQGNGQLSSPTPYPRRSPIVYPALLSRVAEALRARIVLTDIVKDGLTYKNAFDGRQAVDKIAYIIKTTDRNLALLLGRALDAQKYFHAVTYDHRLRDSASDVYQFRTRVGSPFHSGDLSPPAVTSPSSRGTSTPTPDARLESDTGSPSNDASTESDPGKQLDTSTILPDASMDPAEDVLLPTGVFTLLTDCYSPTCSRDRLCYSITCPRRLEQQSRLNMKPLPGLGIKRQLSRESLGDLDNVEPGLLWIHTVSKEIVDSVSDQEKRRQEAINEVIYTERDFVRDMEYLRDVCSPLDPFAVCVLMKMRRSGLLHSARRTSYPSLAALTLLSKYFGTSTTSSRSTHACATRSTSAKNRMPSSRASPTSSSKSCLSLPPSYRTARINCMANTSLRRRRARTRPLHSLLRYVCLMDSCFFGYQLT